MIVPRIPARSSRSNWLLVGLLVVVMKISIRQHRCSGLDQTLAKPCGGQLTEKPDVLVLHSLTGVNSEFIPQQDSQAFVRREGLRHVAARRERTHQQQMS